MDRSALRDLLLRWQSGEQTERDVHEQAEQHYDTLSDSNTPACARYSIEHEVLASLSILNHQWIIPEDIPVILNFLDTPAGDEADGWERWETYWDGIDYSERRASLKSNPYYVASPTRRGG